MARNITHKTFVLYLKSTDIIRVKISLKFAKRYITGFQGNFFFLKHNDFSLSLIYEEKRQKSISSLKIK